ncbi:DUF374 domain-containing protein [bacterium]|nr:DUF374 domain-containing protein [bacterium]
MSFLEQAAGQVILLMESLACFSSNIKVISDPLAKEMMEQGRPVIFVFWHHNIPIILYRFRHNGYIPLISLSKDAGLLLPVLNFFGYGIFRGSSTRGGVSALKRGFYLLNQGRSLALTPDGPIGPRYSFKAGAVIYAAETEIPVIPVGAALYRKFTLNTWDGMEIPKPYSIASIRVGKPYYCHNKNNKKEDVDHLLNALITEEKLAEKDLKKRLRTIFA